MSNLITFLLSMGGPVPESEAEWSKTQHVADFEDGGRAQEAKSVGGLEAGKGKGTDRFSSRAVREECIPAATF